MKFPANLNRGTINFGSPKCVSNCHLQNGCHFVSTSMHSRLQWAYRQSILLTLVSTKSMVMTVPAIVSAMKYSYKVTSILNKNAIPLSSLL